MQRLRMARTTIRSERRTLLPQAVVYQLKCYMFESAGITLMAAAVLVATALGSYHHSDPSFNTASKGVTQNLLGPAGAYTADLLLQVLGIAAVLFPLLFFAWGWRLIKKNGISVVWARLLISFGGVILSTIFVSTINEPEAWPLHSGLGGASGTVIYSFFIDVLSQYMPGFEIAFIAGITLPLGFFSLVFAAGLDKSDWLALWFPLRTGFSHCWQVVMLIRKWAPTPKERLEPNFSPKIADNLENVGNGQTDPEFQNTKMENDGTNRLFRQDMVEEKLKGAAKGKRATSAEQGCLALSKNEGFQLPPLNLLEAPSEKQCSEETDKEALSKNAQLLESVLDDFGIKGDIVKVRPGPVVTLYELEPSPGTKTSRVVGLADDIARSMSALSVRIAVVPGRSVIGIELPNSRRDMVYFRELLASAAFEKSTGALTLVLGKDIGGSPNMVDLARMPHLLIAGTTGSGKSVAVNTMICSLLYRLPPDQCKFIMIDPKMLELSVYDGIPNLLAPVVTDPSKAVFALKWAVREMEDRYRLLSQIGVRNITGYNNRLAEARKTGETLTRRVHIGFDEGGKPKYEDQPLSMDPLPLIVLVVDEMADLMMVAGKDIEAAIQRLAQMARAAGIHLIMATQRPSVDVITGTIKANFPTRVSFQVTSKIDSRTILGEQGAEQLLGQGDMLYMAGGGQITRVHGPFISDEEVEYVVRFLKDQADPEYVEDITADVEGGFAIPSREGSGSSDNRYYDEAIALVAREGKASTSFIQRHLQIGYNRAARIMEQLEEQGVVSKADRVGRREVLVKHH